MKRAAGLVLLVLLAGCAETVDGDATPVALCPDGGEPGELVDGATVAVGSCLLLGGYDIPTQRYMSEEASDENVLAPVGADRRLFTGELPGVVVVTVRSYSADCPEGEVCAQPNEDDELTVTVTG